MRLLAFDSETFLIAPGRPVPPLVCVTTCEPGQEPAIFHVRGGEGQRRVLDALRDPQTLVIGHNVMFDLPVIVDACGAREEALRAVFDALDAGRVRDTLIRQKVFHIRRGDLQRLKRGDLSLAALSKLYLGEEMSKGEDTWRLRYSELVNVPLPSWPTEASHYAKHDARQTLRVFVAQEELFGKMKYQGKEPHSAPDECFQLKAAWALVLMSAWGMRTDPAKVDALEKTLQAEVEHGTKILQGASIVRLDGSQDMSALRGRIVTAYEQAGLGKPPATEKGGISTSKETIEVVVSVDPILRVVHERKHSEKILGTFLAPAKHGTIYPITASFNSLLATTRTSCTKPNLQNLPKKAGVRGCFVPRPGYIYCDADYTTLEMRTFAQIMYELKLPDILRQALIKDMDPHSMLGATVTGVSYDDFVARRKAGDDEIEATRDVAKCFHPDVEFLTKTGWKRFDDLGRGEEIMQAHPSTSECTLSWATPFNMFSKQSSELVHLYNEGISLPVTPDHRMLAYKRDQRKGHEGEKVPVVVTPVDMNSVYGWWNAGTWEGGDVEVDETLLRLAVATQADGSRSGKFGIRFGFTKKRKIDRFRSLFSAYIGSDNPRSFNGVPGVAFRIGDDGYHGHPRPGHLVWELLTDTKEFPWWWIRLSLRCRKVVLDEVRYWDAHTIPGGRAARFDSTSKDSVEVIQTLAAITGLKTRRGVASRVKEEHHRSVESVTVRDKGDSRGGNVDIRTEAYNGRVVCLSVPSSFVLVRYGGVPVITGQCSNFGMMGGLGAPAFQRYVKQFGIDITLERSKGIKDGWMRTWGPAGYFEWVNRLLEDSGNDTAVVPILVHGGGHLLRGQCRYTVACNTPFQARAARGAKEALWRMVREMYLERSSDIFGSRLVNFIHDETLCEVPEEHASPAAARITKIMVESMESVTPDVPQKAPAKLMRCWDKRAKPVLDDEGNLIPWDAEEAA